MYAIRDTKANTFYPPTLFDNDAVATRAFGDMVLGDKNTLIGTHPSDFSVCYVGDFDLETGTLIPSKVGYVVLANGSDFVKGE
jgi:hypothetical protein